MGGRPFPELRNVTSVAQSASQPEWGVRGKGGGGMEEHHAWLFRVKGGAKFKTSLNSEHC